MEIQIQHAEEYKNRGDKAFSAAEAIIVCDEESYAAMGDVLGKIKQGMRTIETKLNEPIEKAHQLHKWLTGVRTQVLGPWKSAETLAKNRMGDYSYKLMVVKRDAEKKAEAERQKLAADQARKAQAALEANKPEKAAAILEKPIVPKTIVPEAPKTEKQITLFVYGYEITDETLLPREYLKPDLAKINQRVQADKMDCKISGVKVIESAGVRSR